MMMRTVLLSSAALALAASSATAQQPAPAGPQPYAVGNPVGLPVAATPGTTFAPVSPNVKMFGALYSAESCSYDPVRNLIVVPSRGVPQNVQTNNAWIAFINHDGSVHTPRWIGWQNPGDQRNNSQPPLVLNEPLGSDIEGGILYLADRDGGTTQQDPSVSVIRKFDMKTGAPAGEIKVAGSTGFNDIEVAADGTIYATQTGGGEGGLGQLWKVTKDGASSLFLQGAPLRQPNGIAIDPQGNIVVVQIGNNEVLTFSPEAKLVRTETAVQPGNDGLVIMADGTKYVSSVQQGGVSRIRPGQKAEMIAQNIPSAASMCYDAGANQLVIPMNANNGLAFVPLK
jgi:sugar lactone lactonase YvrE